MAWTAEARAAAAAARKRKGALKQKSAKKASTVNKAAMAKVKKPKHVIAAQNLKRKGDASYAKAGGTSKPHYKTNGQVVLATKVAVASLKQTLHRVATGNKKAGYKAATVVTQKGSFQASIGKKVFSGGSRNSLNLSRGSIGKGFEMKSASAPKPTPAGNSRSKSTRKSK